MRALVTGANGFLGRHVVEALLRRGHQVRALVRPAARVDDLGWPPSVELFRADLRAARDLEAAFEGVDVLVHLAAAVTGGDDLQLAVTVGGTEKLLDAMARTACRRVVLASSFAVYDRDHFGGRLDEGSPVLAGAALYEMDGYSISKTWQERVTRRKAEEHGWDLTVLRPGFVWGRDHAYLSAMGQQLGRVHVVIGPFTRIPLTHVENCADLFAVAAADPRAAGQTFNVVDGPGERIWSFLGEYLRRSGQRGFRIPVPYLLAYGIVALFYATLFQRNAKLPHVLVPCRFAARLKPFRYSNRRAREVLGWTPPLDHRTCLERTFGAAAPTPARLSAAGSAPAP